MKNIYETGNETVDKLGRMNLTGNIIPSAWFRTVLKPTGKPNLNAIVLLSDIVYWYRPAEIRDESTGRLVGMKKRFGSDMLQRSYQQMADQFGITKRDATNAIVELEKLGLIRRVFRTITVRGQQMPNILFIQLCVDRLLQFTYPEICEEHFGGVPDLGEGCHSNEGDVSPICVTGPTCNGDTSGQNPEGGITEMVETNTENTNRDYYGDYPLISYHEEMQRFKDQIGYETLKHDYAQDRKLDELIGIAVDVLTSSAETIRVNRENKPAAVVQSQFRKLTMFHIQFVLECMSDNRIRARNVRAVMVTALYNSVHTMEHYYDNLFNYHSAEEERTFLEGG